MEIGVNKRFNLVTIINKTILKVKSTKRDIIRYYKKGRRDLDIINS